MRKKPRSVLLLAIAAENLSVQQRCKIVKRMMAISDRAAEKHNCGSLLRLGPSASDREGSGRGNPEPRIMTPRGATERDPAYRRFRDVPLAVRPENERTANPLYLAYWRGYDFPVVPPQSIRREHLLLCAWLAASHRKMDERDAARAGKLDRALLSIGHPFITTNL